MPYSPERRRAFIAIAGLVLAPLAAACDAPRNPLLGPPPPSEVALENPITDIEAELDKLIQPEDLEKARKEVSETGVSHIYLSNKVEEDGNIALAAAHIKLSNVTTWVKALHMSSAFFYATGKLNGKLSNSSDTATSNEHYRLAIQWNRWNRFEYQERQKQQALDGTAKADFSGARYWEGNLTKGPTQLSPSNFRPPQSGE